jgi:hypothetical protein
MVVIRRRPLPVAVVNLTVTMRVATIVRMMGTLALTGTYYRIAAYTKHLTNFSWYLDSVTAIRWDLAAKTLKTPLLARTAAKSLLRVDPRMILIATLEGEQVLLQYQNQTCFGEIS